MFYIIYKITNIINNKIYIGKHKTHNINDSYMGSGKYLHHAIKKYGIENFNKEILFQFNNESDMNKKEKEIVTEEFCLRNDTYNICPGGNGGFTYINNQIWTNDSRKDHNIKISGLKAQNGFDRNLYKNIYSINSQYGRKAITEKYPNGTFYGRSHTEDTKKKMSKTKNAGPLNSQFGTMWITNGQENKKIKKDVDLIPEGWYKGRSYKAC